MRAAVYRGSHDIKIEEVPEPEVSGRKVLVKFKAESICGFELNYFEKALQTVDNSA